MSNLISIATPLRQFKGHEASVAALAVFPDKRRIVTCSWDRTLRLWDLKTGVVLKKMEHCTMVRRLAVSRDGQLIASSDHNGEVIIWHGETLESLTEFEAHSYLISSLDLSPDGTMLATGSYDEGMTKLWNTKTWQVQGDPIECGDSLNCVRYSPSGELLAITTDNDIQIYNSGTRKRVASFKGHTEYNSSLAWTPDGTRILTGGSAGDPTIREWDTTNWKQNVHLWQLSDRQTIAIFKHPSVSTCVTFSVDGNHILSGDADNMISEWAVPQGIHPKILAITTARDACIDGDLSAAAELLAQNINTDPNNHTSYAHRSFVMARKHDWDHALHDAIKSISIQPSLTGYISKGIALCGKGRVQDARAAFDVASMYTDQDSQILHFLLLIKVIALFNANQHDEANLLLRELTSGCPNADTRACHTVEAYLRVQLGLKALDGACHDEAADHFTAALDTSNLSSKSDIHEIYEDLVVLFGWDLKLLWLTAHQKRCQAFLSSGKVDEALESHKSMVNNIDETTKARCLDWSTGNALFLVNGDTVLAAGDYDRAIDLYSVVIDLNSASDVVFVKRSKARLGKMLWMEALLDAQKVTELNSSSYLGYSLKHAALHGAQRYDEAIQAFRIMLSKLDNAHDTETRKLRQQYLGPFEVDRDIRKAINAQLDNTPLRVLDTTTGLLCDREAQIRIFKMSKEYKELVSSTITHSDFRMKRIKEVVMTYFQYAMLSHRWEGKEPLLQDIQGKVVYELGPVGGITKLQSFCKTTRDLGYRWAWSDTCCIDKSNSVELQESVNSMFIWYHHSALTVVYLSDVPPSSKSGALAKSAWNTRGWTVQEFLAPNVILFYQKDWTPYLSDRTPNHKDSVAIMRELEYATGIDRRAVVAFRPGMRGAREKLQWASTRITTMQEDIAYSLFGIFGITLPVIYGEKKQSALGRFLQEIIAQSGDITALDWSLVSSLRGGMALETASILYQTVDYMSAPRFAYRRLHLPCIVFPVTDAMRGQSRDQDTYTYDLKSNGLHDLQIATADKLIPFSRARPPPAWQTILLVRPWSRDLLELYDSADDAHSVVLETMPKSPSHDSLPAQTEPIYSESHSRALRLIVRLGQPFSALLLARQRNGEFKRIASDHDIIAQVEDMASIRYLMDIRTLEIV
ncbi:uncharacterized protein HD556DRAFT_1527625 [Suillus plorans]|uniref:Heterokaryon incompatibility domain-containing protein n=1 Tax=Suillus plorans TaxID=116603 RepID=A0A9P7DHM4_9AGAM|nr:uncharacterized protein HD556DRAFT_1527625 [Suillus plorans]KAG1793101.1 hypothetical protein HD556DRAFT_1527625 [Suillus plorans]